MGDNIPQTVGVRKMPDGTYRAEPFFERARMGNAQPIAFGGIALSQAISAGWDTVTPGMNLYSAQGSYLSGASTDIPTTYTVTDLRTTRTFCTRLVFAYQSPSPSPAAGPKATPKETAPGAAASRRILVILLEWQTPEEGMMDYSTSPIHPPPPPSDLPDQESFVRQKLGNEAMFKVYMNLFGPAFRLYEYKPVPCMASDNVMGLKPGVGTSQDHLELNKRTAASWVRVKGELQKEGEHAGAVAFLMDGGLAFLPLTLTNRSLTEASAASSLDFSLRIFSPPDMTKWHLHEQHTERGAGGRTFSVGKLYDEGGVEVACMTQMSILRGKRGKDGVRASL